MRYVIGTLTAVAVLGLLLVGPVVLAVTADGPRPIEAAPCGGDITCTAALGG